MDRLSVSSSAEFDKPQYWNYERSSALPYGYFKERWSFRQFLRRIIAAIVYFEGPK